MISLNAYIWGFDDSYTRDVIRRLDSEKIIKIKRWFISENMEKDEWFLGKEWVELPWRFDLIKDFKRRNLFTPVDVDNHIFANLEMILHNFTRATDCFCVPMHEAINMVHCLKNHYYYLLKKDNPDIILFYNLPHYPEGIVLYFLAKAMGIKTLLLTMTSFIGEITYCYSLDDYGEFRDVPEYVPLYKKRSLENIEISYKIQMPYTTPKCIKHDMGLDKPLTQKLRALLHPVDYCYERYKLIVGNYSAKYESFTDFLEMRLHKIINNKLGRENYSKRFRNLVLSNFDINDDYVYFPLHLQPEMSTDTQGGVYTDQLLALEKLVACLPKGWKIFVKENPKQTYYKRGKYFFQRLKSIPNVFLLDRSVDTVLLMQHAKIVATINGTAAYEAVKGGTPAVIFGKYWYNGLEGIFQYYDGLDMAKVSSYKIDRDALAKGILAKKKKMVPVVLYDNDIQYVEEFNETRNKDELYNFLKYILPLVR